MPKKIALAFLFASLSCTSFSPGSWLPNLPSVAESSDIMTLEQEVSYLFHYMTIGGLVGGVVTFALSFKIPFMSHVSGVLFIGAVTSWGFVQALAVLAIIKWVVICALITFGGFHLHKRAKAHKEEVEGLDAVAREVCQHFNNPDGEKELSEKTRDFYTMARPLRNIYEKDLTK